jgi:hypothetical protein
VKTAAWAGLLALAVLWPSRITGPLDGAPLDQPAEVLVVSLLLPLLLAADRRALARPAMRGCIAALLAWKAFSATALTQDGWCVRFVTPAPLFSDMGLVPHTWDVRADWRSPEPRCSAIVDRTYASFERFPVWFYNLPPATLLKPAEESDRPPNVRLNMSVTGALHVERPGQLRVEFDEDIRASIQVDGRDRTPDNNRGIDLEAGAHSIAIAGELHGSRWRFHPTWNGSGLWSSGAVATVARPSTVERWLRPWAGFLPLLLIAAVMGGLLLELARKVADARFALFALAGVACLALGGAAGGVWARSMPLLLLLLACVAPVPERLRGGLGFLALIAAPWLAFFAVRIALDAGVITLYTSGDDWWMFQRYAYRIYLQGYWLEGGQITFWFQPLYRWIAGALHLLFGDSSVGELAWDAWCVLAGSLFAFIVVNAVAGFRWAIAAAATTLAVFVVGPAWYLFGRGLSEISSAGFIYLAAILALHAQQGHNASAVLAGIAATLAFYTRLNNLPMVLALAAFALPMGLRGSDAWPPQKWWNAASRPVVAGILGAIAIGLWFFTWRTYHYTGVPSMLHGTQSGSLAAWQYTTEGLTPLQNLAASVLMVLSMNDPPRFDVRAIPIVIGVTAATLGLFRVPIARQLPLNAIALCLAGVAGAFVARGSAYPGRFSVHLIPVAVALAFALGSLVVARVREAGR